MRESELIKMANPESWKMSTLSVQKLDERMTKFYFDSRFIVGDFLGSKEGLCLVTFQLLW